VGQTEDLLTSMSVKKESADFSATSTTFILAQLLEESHVTVDENSLSIIRITRNIFAYGGRFGLKSREYGRRVRHADHVASSIRKSWH
jgi:hypothetical protein